MLSTGQIHSFVAIANAARIPPPRQEDLTVRMKAAVRAHLVESHRHATLMWYSRETKYNWASDMWLSALGTLTPLKRDFPTHRLRKFMNKPSVFYWASTAQENGQFTSVVTASIYKEGFRCHDWEPNYELGHFFANPIRITPTGPATISSIIKAHGTICDWIETLLSLVKQGGYDQADMESCRLDTHYHQLFPSCRAIVMVYDVCNSDWAKNSEGYILLHEVICQQTVLMVRTGDERGLSEPINFDTIRGESLPMERSDFANHDRIETVRVSMLTAVRLIADLQRKEEAAFPILNTREYGIKAATALAGRDLKLAAEVGIENVSSVEEEMSSIRLAEREPSLYTPVPKEFWSEFNPSWI